MAPNYVSNNEYRVTHGDYRTENDLESNSKELYQEQKNLPRLPVPDLRKTCELYLQSVQPLLSAQEFLNTKDAVDDFLKPNGIGENLQKRLILRANNRKDTSWLAEWWNKLAYLQVRDPVVFNVSYFFHFSDSLNPLERTQVGRAASLLRATMEFRNQVANGSLPPERIGKKQTPLCATAYKYMFNACRIPEVDEDSYRLYDPRGNNHVVIIRNNKFYSFEIMVNGKVLSFDDISQQLTSIIKHAGSKESSIGSLSSNNRDIWAKDRQQLIRDGNEALLKIIESSILILCLDDCAPVSRSAIARELWHGDGRNRFYDKIIQLIVFENGKAGILAEHSMLDGMAMTVYADYILTRLKNGSIDMGRDILPDEKTTSLRVPEKLNFKFSPKIIKSIATAEEVFDASVAAHEVSVESFYGYGKEQIKKFKCSPDAFVQMAIQLAYRKLFGCSRPTYESTQTRNFYHGRTETTRSVSNASIVWVDKMVKDSPGTPSTEKAKLLREAINSHVKYMQLASQGNGVDRHLLGLQLCLRPEESEHADARLFKDPIFATSKHWNISTSHLTHELFDGWGWGQVVPDGLGIAYSIKKNSCHFNIACLKHPTEWATGMTWFIEESLREMSDLMMFENQSTSSKL